MNKKTIATDLLASGLTSHQARERLVAGGATGSQANAAVRRARRTAGK